MLQQRNPFTQDHLLLNIITGVTADQKVNADKAVEMAINLIKSMEGKNVMEYTFRKANQVIHNS